jgi:hypothetical protein
VQKFFFHFLLINQVEQLQHGAKYMSKCGKGTVTPFYLEILKQKFQTLAEYERTLPFVKLYDHIK